MDREIAHLKAFGRALEGLGKGPWEIGALPSNEKNVRPYFNDSTGDGDLGADTTGPWNAADDVEVVQSPALT